MSHTHLAGKESCLNFPAWALNFLTKTAWGQSAGPVGHARSPNAVSDKVSMDFCGASTTIVEPERVGRDPNLFFLAPPIP